MHFANINKQHTITNQASLTKTVAKSVLKSLRRVLPMNTTGIPHFQKTRVTSLHFYEKPTLVPDFTNRKKSRGFSLSGKKEKSENSILRLFQSQPSPRQPGPQQQERPGKLPPPELHLASQHQVSTALNCVCEHRCFISIYFVSKMCPKESEKPERLFWGSENTENIFHLN